MNLQALQEALGQLEEELDRREILARVYLVNGRMMHVSYLRPRRGKDDWNVFDRLLPDDSILQAAARSTAAKLGLADDWLGEIEKFARRNPQPSGIAATLHNKPALVVSGASASYALMIKANAGRPADREDIQWLMQQLKIPDAQGVKALHDSIFPLDALPDNLAQEINERVLGLGRPPSRGR